MNIAAMIIFAALLVFPIASLWGLVNRDRSILCAIAGVVTLCCAGLGGLHAWGESQSIPWTVAYAAFALVGAVSAVRQVLPKEITS